MRTNHSRTRSIEQCNILYRQHFSSTCNATLSRYKLKIVFARITTSLLSRNKILLLQVEKWTFSRHHLWVMKTCWKFGKTRNSIGNTPPSHSWSYSDFLFFQTSTRIINMSDICVSVFMCTRCSYCVILFCSLSLKAAPCAVSKVEKCKFQPQKVSVCYWQHERRVVSDI